MRAAAHLAGARSQDTLLIFRIPTPLQHQVQDWKRHKREECGSRNAERNAGAAAA